jgi:hypothetical protein
MAGTGRIAASLDELHGRLGESLPAGLRFVPLEKKPPEKDDCQHPPRKLAKVGTVTKGGITYEVWRCRTCGARIVQ